MAYMGALARTLCLAVAALLLLAAGEPEPVTIALSDWDPRNAQVFGGEAVVLGDLPEEWQELDKEMLSAWAFRLPVLAEAHSSAGDTAAALVTYRQCIALSRLLDDMRLLAKAANAAGLLLKHQGDYSGAMDYYELGLVSLRNELDPAGNAAILSNIGVLHGELGNYADALDCHQRSLALRREVRDKVGEAKELRLSGEAYTQLRQYDPAHTLLTQALDLSHLCGDRDGEARVLSAQGSLYDALGFYERGLACHQQALTIFKELDSKVDEAAALHNIGELHRMLGRYPAALSSLTQSLVLSRELGDDGLAGATLNSIGNAHYQMGQFQLALEHLEESLSLKRLAGDTRSAGLALNSIGLVYHSAGLYDRALEYYADALKMSQACGAQEDEASTLANIGSVHRLKGDLSQAAEYYDRALTLCRQLDYRQMVSVILNNLGVLRRLLGQLDSALSCHQQALAIARELSDRDGEAEALSNIGLTYILGEQFEKALPPLAQGLELARAGGDLQGQWHGLHYTGWARALAGDFAAALPDLEQAFAIARQQARQFTWESGLKSGIVEELNITGTLLGRVQLALDDDEGAFATSQAVKGVPLLQLLLQSQLTVDSPKTQQALDDYRSAQAALAKYRHDLALLPADAIEQRDTLAGLIAKHEALAANAWDYLREHEPRLTEIAEIKGLGAADVQQHVLKPGQVVIEYLVAPPLGGADPGELIIFALPKEGSLTVWRQTLPAMPEGESFGDWVGKRVDMLLSPNADDSQAAARELYDVLLAPVAEAVASSSELLICPDRELFIIPFEALEDASGTPLLDHATVSYATSATMLSYSGRDAPAGGAVVAGVSFMVDDADPLRHLAALTSLDPVRGGMLRHSDLPPLPGVRAEAREVAQLLGVTPLLDEAVTEGRLRRELPGNAIAHLATHGFLASSPLLNGIALAAGDRAGTGQSSADGFLTMAEVMGLKLDACQLVALSCCHSAEGETSPGAGVMGVCQGFMYAGADSVLASLTAVDDEATRRLMVEFYRNWHILGMGKAAALRAAKLSLMAEPHFTAPRYWAPFVLYGLD